MRLQLSGRFTHTTDDLNSSRHLITFKTLAKIEIPWSLFTFQSNRIKKKIKNLK